VRALGHPEWTADPRFATTEARLLHAPDLTRQLQEVFRSQPREHWTDVFDREGVWWSPVQATHETIEDPQARAAGGVVEVPTGEGTTVPGVASPVDFSATPWRVRDMPPELGQHTELVLAELGFDWERIDELRQAGVIG
jgi:crotonobetainyl-CoA:carnitine CoA-transferase CaiB-like acyl-CoA transferase